MFSDAAELLPESTLPPTTPRGVDLSGNVGDLVGQLQVRLPREATGDRDHSKRGAAVAGAKGTGSGRPWVDDGDHTVDRGDPCQSGTDRCRDSWVVDVDVVGDDGDLAAGLGEFVEPLDDAA